MVAIFVAFMFVSLVLTDLMVEKWRVWRAATSGAQVRIALETLSNGLAGLCQVPEGIHLTGQHAWVKPNPAGGLEIGVDALIAHAVGAVRRIILPNVGDSVTAGQPLFRLEREGRTITIPSAFTGRVMAVNTRLAEQPGLLSSDPYEAGWVCYVTPTQVDKSAGGVRFGEQAVMWLEKEFVRFSEFVFAQVSPDLAVGATSQDGGVPAVGCLSELSPAAWADFEANFLRPS